MSVSRRSPDIVVVSPWRGWICAGCGSADEDPLVMEDCGPVCMSCADLAHLVYLPRGDTALTRRSRKHSRLSAVVVRFSSSRRRYERQGVLVEETAIVQAETECLGDEDARARQRERAAQRRESEDVAFQRELASEIAILFPACPPERREEIAAHTAQRGSGRVGRTAAARALDPDAITLAVIAAIRHGHTNYELRMAGVDRGDARQRIHADVEQTLEAGRGSRLT